MSFVAKLRSMLRMQILRCGYTIVPYPLKRYLDAFNIDCIFDVGANVGQYARDIRGIGFQGRIESFEPMSEAFRVLQQNAAPHRNWNVHNFALGDEASEKSLNISANGPSSSFLPLSDDARNAEIALGYVEQERVKVKRLDDVFPQIRGDAKRFFLKVDTQGFEKQVIDGAEKSLSEFVGLQIELSLTRQYEGELLASQFLDFMDGRGFAPYWVIHGYRSQRTMQLKQMDVLFFRVPAS